MACKSSSVRTGTEVGPKDSFELVNFVQPVVMSNECESRLGGLTRKNSFFVLFLDVEEVSLGHKWLWNPPVGVNSINCDSGFFPVDGDSLIEALLIEAEIVKEAFILIFSLDNFDGVIINHFDAGDGGVLVSSAIEEGPSSSLSPVNIFKMVFGNHVLVSFKSENHIY